MEIYMDPTKSSDTEFNKESIIQELLEVANKIAEEYRKGKPKPKWVIPDYDKDKTYVVEDN